MNQTSKKTLFQIFRIFIIISNRRPAFALGSTPPAGLFRLLVQLACSACLRNPCFACLCTLTKQPSLCFRASSESLSRHRFLSLSSHVARTIELFGPAQSLTSGRTTERRRDLSTHTHTHQLTLASEFSFVFKSFCSKLFTSYKLRISLSSLAS